MFMNHQWKRFLSLALALLMVMGMVSVQAFATENVEETEEPAVTETVENSGPEDPVPETTVAPETATVPETTAPVQPSEPEEDAAVKSVQALIDALPETITEANQEEVIKLLEAIDETKAALSEEQRDTLDFAKYEAAASALGEDHTPAPLADVTLCARVKENTTGTLTLEYYVTADVETVDYVSFQIGYPNDLLELTGVEASEQLKKVTSYSFDWSSDDGIGIVLYQAQNSATVDLKANETLFTATFEVLKSGTVDANALETARVTVKYGGVAENVSAGTLVLENGETELSVTKKTDPGDVNDDGTVNAYDAWLILKYVAGDTVEGSLLGDQDGFIIGDVNRDGELMNSDAYWILKHLVGLT